MITPEPPAGSEHYREGWRHGYEQAAIDRERSADAVRLVPDDVQAQAREGLPSVPDEMWLTSDWGVIESDGSGAWRTVENGSYVEHLPAVRIRLVPDTAGRCGDIGDLLFNKRYCCELRAGHAGWHREGVTEWSARAAGAVPDTGQAPESPTDSTPKSGRCDSSDTETATGAVQAPDVADLAYARSEVDKWLASTDPYCILPTRTEHIPALLARLDELEGTS